MTAEGVFRGTKLVAEQVFGSADLSGLTVAMQGVGHVGGYLADKLHAAGAKLIVTDVNAAVLNAVAERTGATVVPPAAIFDVEADIFAPCALGGAINEETLKRLQAKAIVGAANNQLASHAIGRAVFERGIVYAPDYVVNGGGIINVAAEIRALDAGDGVRSGLGRGQAVAADADAGRGAEALARRAAADPRDRRRDRAPPHRGGRGSARGGLKPDGTGRSCAGPICPSGGSVADRRSPRPTSLQRQPIDWGGTPAVRRRPGPRARPTPQSAAAALPSRSSPTAVLRSFWPEIRRQVASAWPVTWSML